VKSLILLHGALGSAAQLKGLLPELRDHFDVHVPILPGHGGKAIPEAGYSFVAFADFVLSYMDEQSIEKADFFGYSLGGYLALILAGKAPDRVGRIITLGTKFDWNTLSASREVKMLDPDTMEQKIPIFTEFLEVLHHPVPWRTMVQETASFILRLGEKPDLSAAELKAINHNCLLFVGEKDNSAGVEATRTAAMCIQNSEFRVLNDTPHPIEKVDISILCGSIVKFLKK